ncbi:hypothetical protein VCRLGP7_100016 [Vibrio crassostreae]|nr:hypothetical protein VCRLGP7_100016 [Vibrio crassostreae]
MGESFMSNNSFERVYDCFLVDVNAMQTIDKMRALALIINRAL